MSFLTRISTRTVGLAAAGVLGLSSLAAAGALPGVNINASDNVPEHVELPTDLPTEAGAAEGAEQNGDVDIADHEGHGDEVSDFAEANNFGATVQGLKDDELEGQEFGEAVAEAAQDWDGAQFGADVAEQAGGDAGQAEGAGSQGDENRRDGEFRPEGGDEE